MNTRTLFIIALISLSFSAYSQVHQHAIGLRGSGGTYGYGPEISYQKGITEMNRVELDLGWYTRKNYNNGVGWGSGNAYQLVAFTAIYHWDWNIMDGLNWYVGPGGQIVYYNEKYFDGNDGIYFAIVGQIGLEYDFTDLGAPLLLGIDYRPRFNFNWYDEVGHGAALSLRYLID